MKKDRLTEKQLICLRSRDQSAAEIVDVLFEIIEDIDQRTLSLEEQIKNLHEEQAEIQIEINKLINDAFVNADLVLHKSMQQADLNSKNWRRDVWTSAVKTISTTAIVSIVAFIFYAILESIKSELKK
jgi:vacuolar-type H+-ATPase subunit I/STV1